MATGIDLSTIKMLDFDNSAHLRNPNDKIGFKKGTPEYMAPEGKAMHLLLLLLRRLFDASNDVFVVKFMRGTSMTTSVTFGHAESWHTNSCPTTCPLEIANLCQKKT